MMKKELRKKFEELRDAVSKLDTERTVFGVDFNRKNGLAEIHCYNCDFPAHEKCDEQYVWVGGEHYPWIKQVIINGVKYFDCITQEQFDREHAKEGNNDDNQQDGQERNA